MKLPVQCGATGRWEISGGTPPQTSLVPEAFFDTNLVNGAPYPVLKVSPRRYRFQTLNAAQARFYNLQWYVADQSPDGITLIESA
jgi:FtsP/CotA-like multicopper oxidase with cupredoxin domain